VSGILSHIPTGSVLHRIGEGNSQLDVAKLLNRIREDLHPGQRAFVDDDKTEILGISAGYGAGKTRALAAKSVFMAAANQGFTGCVMEPTGPLIRDIWQADFEGFLEQYEIPYTFRASPLPEYLLHFPRSLAALGPATCASSAPRQRLKASVGCGTPLAPKRRSSAKTASSLGCARRITHFCPKTSSKDCKPTTIQACCRLT
jgi:hypothetical protein